MEEKIVEAKRLISSIAEEGHLVANFSGGRDSLAVLLLALDVDSPVAWFMRSSIDLPGTIGFVKNVCRDLGAKLVISNPEEYQGDFYAHVRRWGYFPTIQKPWCGCKLKVRPQRAKMRVLWGRDSVYKLTGIRRSESSRRLYRYSSNRLIEPDPEHSGSYLVYPILEWSKKDVKRFLERCGMNEHQGYKICGVSGCFYCPFYQDSIIIRIAHVFPGIYDKIIGLENELDKPSLQGHKFISSVLKRAHDVGTRLLVRW